MTRVHVISHTHWDREWYMTFEQYRARLVDLVDGVLERMSRDPRFTFFHLDGQTVVVQDYLEIRPEREAEIRARVAEGRLLIGPWYVMPDMFLVSGEALVRNLARGMRLAREFGGVMRVGYMPDPFGHVAQMPQILAGFGLDGAILWRGFGGDSAEYLWEGPDGTRALLLHLPRDGYCNGLRLPLQKEDDMRSAARAVVEAEAARSRAGEVLLMVGVDHVEPHPRLHDLTTLVDGLPETHAALSTLPEYVRAVRERTTTDGLSVVKGELRAGEEYAHLLPGVLSARTYLKQANAQVQRELEHWAEPASALALLCGTRMPAGALDYAWRTLLQNHPHDSICGCSIDEVHEENVTRFGKAGQAAREITGRALRVIATQVPAAPPGTLRSIAVNTDASAWSGVLEAVIEIPLTLYPGVDPVDVASVEELIVFAGEAARITDIRDGAGTPLPFQILEERDVVSYRMSRYAPPVAIRARRVRVALQLFDLPPLGYTCIDAIVGREAAPAGSVAAEGVSGTDTSLENASVRIETRPDGSIDVLDKRRGTWYRGVFSLEDVGDAGDEYNYSPPVNDLRVTNAEARGIDVRMLERGPLVGRLGISYSLSVPGAISADRRGRADDRVQLGVYLEVWLRADSPGIECRASIQNSAHDHRVRVLCPTGAARIQSHRSDTAFGVVERPVTKVMPQGELTEMPVSSAPMQSFVDAGDSVSGAVVVTDGLVEHEVLNTHAGGVVAVTLLRCVGDLSRNDLTTRRGHAGPGLRTPGAQCQGRREFRFAFVPRGTPPSARELFATARSFLSPPRLVAASAGSGGLPPRHSFLRMESEPPGAVLSACKVADDGQGVVLRVFNSGAGRTRVRLHLPEGITRGRLADLAETGDASCLDADGRSAVAELHGHRIQTIRLDGPAFGAGGNT
jgi:2-O-(6-phospho-alpha-D-mannosyl)-D-glycerate hydrolase